MVMGKRKALAGVNKENRDAGSSSSSSVAGPEHGSTMEQKLELFKLGKSKANDVTKELIEWKKKSQKASKRNAKLEQQLQELRGTLEEVSEARKQEQESRAKEMENQKRLIEQANEIQANLENLLKQQEAQMIQVDNKAFEADNYSRTLKKSLKHVISEHDKLEEQVFTMSKTEKELPILQSHIVELELLKRLTECDAEATREDKLKHKKNLTKKRRVCSIDVGERQAMECRAEALQMASRVASRKASVHAAHSAQLQFANELLLQQMAEVIDEGKQSAAEARAEHQSAARDMNSFVASMQQQMSDSLAKSIEKITQLKKQVLELTRENRSLCEQVAQLRNGAP